MIRLAIFDLDGTLIDSIHDIAAAANEVISRYGRPRLSVEQIKAHIGDGVRAFAKGLAGERHDDDAYVKQVMGEFATAYENQMIKSTFFYPGAQEFLMKFLDYSDGEKKMGVVTNKEEKQARAILNHLVHSTPPLHNAFVEIFGGDTFDVKKPHPKPLLRMMEIAGVEPHETLMIGDSRQDLEAAKNAGTHFLGVGFGYNSIETLKGYGAERFFHHYSELFDLIKNWLRP